MWVSVNIPKGDGPPNRPSTHRIQTVPVLKATHLSQHDSVGLAASACSGAESKEGFFPRLFKQLRDAEKHQRFRSTYLKMEV